MPAMIDTPTSEARRLCYDCRYSLANNVLPPHVVHPVNGAYGMYDEQGMARCPKCGAMWHRRQADASELFQFGFKRPQAAAPHVQ